MSSKFTTVRLTIEGEHFEVLVKPDPALNFKLGKKIEVSQIVPVDEVYSDSSKGLRVSSEKLMKYFHTSDISTVIGTIVQRGELQLTTEQRRKMIEDKRKQIISIISRNFVDPKTSLPHPPLRIEQAMEEARLAVDPFKSAEEQAKTAVEKLRTIIPLKSEKLKLQLKVPAQFTPQAIGMLKGFCDIQKEEWGVDGSLTVIVEIPAGVRAHMMERLGSLTRGSVQASVIR